MTIPTSIKEARKTNNQFYYTGKPCKNGHIAKRRTMNANCLECETKSWNTWRNAGAYGYEQTKGYYKKHPEKYLWYGAKARAKRKSWEFDIEASDVVIPTHCPILGMLLEPVCDGRGVLDGSISLDRIDNTKGYVKGNVWVISRRANRIKNDSSLEELRMIVTAMEKHL